MSTDFTVSYEYEIDNARVAEALMLLLTSSSPTPPGSPGIHAEEEEECTMSNSISREATFS